MRLRVVLAAVAAVIVVCDGATLADAAEVGQESRQGWP
jgi:hypothetical protein